jgi:predicted MFS family arabinose efflux permease
MSQIPPELNFFKVKYWNNRNETHRKPLMVNNPTNLSKRFKKFFGLGFELISLMFAIRLIVDTGVRLFIPFIPQLSSGLGLTIAAFSWLLALRSVPGLASPIIGMLADRYGRRIVMVIALVIRGIGFLGLAFATGWWSAIPILLISLGITAYLPIQKAYISDQVSYERRGRALAAIDASYATAGMVGLPIIGWMIEVWSWQAPILMIAVLSFLAALVIGWRLPKTPSRTQTIQQTMWNLFCQPNIFASVIVAGLVVFIFILFMTFWALWLSTDYGLDALEIGLIATSIGIAEFTGLILAGLFIDRIGKRRGTLIGLFLCVLSFTLIPFFQQSILTIRIMLVLTALVIEYVLTASIPLYSEQSPTARATVFALVSFGSNVGAGIAPPATATLFTRGGLEAVVLTGALSSLVALMLTWKFLFDRHDAAPQQLDHFK